MRYVFALAFALALPLAAASAADLEPDALATSRGALYAVDESGAIARTILAESSGSEIGAFAWSPDGGRLATVDPSRNALLVGTVAAGVREIGVLPAAELGRQVAWVSATEIAVHRRAAGQAVHSLWLVSADDGRARLLADSAEPSWPLLPQPGGSLLLYTTGEFRRAVIDVRSGARTLLPFVGDAKWSPDGRLVAAVTREGIDVMRPDGSERRTVVSFPPLTRGVSRIRSLDWSPDGERLAFALGREFAEVPGRFSATVRHEIHTVALDGSGLRRLTGVLGDEAFAGGSLGSIEPSWWPGGSRLFFRRANANAMLAMNADGSCEAPWPGPVGLVSPAWRPGAHVASDPVECSSIIVRAQGEADEVSYRDTLRVRVTLLNDGTRPLRNVWLDLRTTRGMIDVPGRACGGGTRTVCTIDKLPAGRRAVVAADVRFRSTGGTSITASASYAGVDVDPVDDTAAVTADVSPCRLLGTWSSDHLVGTARGELICGRPGGDVIDARAGDDTIHAGSGADTVVAGPGRDRVDGGGGTDTIRVRDGQRDIVDCGSEPDVVFVDRLDVLRSCESVRRR